MTFITDPLFYLLAIPAVTLLGLGKGGFSGIGMMSTPLIALAIPPLQAAAIVQPILLVQDVISVWYYRRHYDSRNIKILLAGAILGIGGAWLIAVHVSDAFVRLMVGVIGLSFVLYTWFGRVPAEPRKPKIIPGVFWGTIAGFTSTLAQAGAPPYQVYVLPQRLEKLTLVGTTVMFFALVNWIKVIPYFAMGQFTVENMTTSALLLPLAIVTNFIGFWLVKRVPNETFYRIAYVLMFLISLELVRGGVMGLLASYV